MNTEINWAETFVYGITIAGVFGIGVLTGYHYVNCSRGNPDSCDCFVRIVSSLAKIK